MVMIIQTANVHIEEHFSRAQICNVRTKSHPSATRRFPVLLGVYQSFCFQCNRCVNSNYVRSPLSFAAHNSCVCSRIGIHVAQSKLNQKTACEILDEIVFTLRSIRLARSGPKTSHVDAAPQGESIRTRNYVRPNVMLIFCIGVCLARLGRRPDRLHHSLPRQR